MNHGPSTVNKSQCESVPGLCDQVVTTCVPVGLHGDKGVLSTPAQYPYVIGSGDANMTGDSVCKTGPPLPMSTSLKNILVIGDSVSDGYTPFVSARMAEVALVQHSPWGMVDGGAEEGCCGGPSKPVQTRSRLSSESSWQCRATSTPRSKSRPSRALAVGRSRSTSIGEVGGDAAAPRPLVRPGAGEGAERWRWSAHGAQYSDMRRKSRHLRAERVAWREECGHGHGD